MNQYDGLDFVALFLGGFVNVVVNVIVNVVSRIAAPPQLIAVLGGVPFARSDGVHMLNIHHVDLFQGSILGLDDEEEDDEHEGRTASGEDETVKVVNVVSNESSAINHNH